MRVFPKFLLTDASRWQAYISAGASVLLLALALVAVSTFDGSKAVALTGAGAPGDLTTEAPATITVVRAHCRAARCSTILPLRERTHGAGLTFRNNIRAARTT